MKKFLACSVVIATAVWSLGLIVGVSKASAAYAPATGDLIKTATNSAVYYVGTDFKRHLYVNSVTFWTYYTGTWSNIKSGDATKTVKTVSQDDFDTVSMGNNITANSGSLIKFDNSDRMYKVTDNGAKLALVSDAATAQRLFGNSWNTKLITIQGSFETDYTKDGILNNDSNSASTSLSANVLAVKSVIETLNSYNSAGNCKGMDDLMTKKTQEALGLINQSATSSTPSWTCVHYQSISFVSGVEKAGGVFTTFLSVHANGLPQEQSVLFIKEDGAWKMGMMETMDLLKQEDSAYSTSSEPVNGLPDLVVTDVKAYPSQPKVNDKNTEILITIKNIGTATSVGIVNSSISVGDDFPTDSGRIGKIAPGQEVSIIHTPYPFQFGTPDKPGSKIVKIIVNDDHSIKESNEANNTFTKEFNFVE